MPTKPPTHRPRFAPSRMKVADPFYKTAAWLSMRRMILNRVPMCVECIRDHRLSASTHVDHKISRQQRPDLALDPDNLQGLCASCHSRKTAASDGGFGNTKG